MWAHISNKEVIIILLCAVENHSFGYDWNDRTVTFLKELN
jgi:hypothetical protein